MKPQTLPLLLLSTGLLLAAIALPFADPDVQAIDYTLSQHQPKPDVSGMNYDDMTMEEIEDELMQHHDDQRALMEKKRKIDAAIKENDAYIRDYEILIKERNLCAKGKEEYCGNMETYVPTGVR